MKTLLKWLLVVALSFVIGRSIVWLSFVFEFKLLCTPVTLVQVKDMGTHQVLNAHLYSCDL